jgi:anthranilate phosphoribosyltransferase
MFSTYLKAVVEGRNLSPPSAHEAMTLIMSGHATPAQIAGFLVALKLKGETPEELLGFARAMREVVVRLEHRENSLIDTCGTGGDAAGTLNISTAAALVAAAAGARVAKHGNRSVTSRCGSADVLEALGLHLELSPQQASQCLSDCGITFLFAPLYHPAMKHAAAPRRELGLRTVFNLLGPITNPAAVTRQVLGVFDRKWAEPLAQVLHELGAEHALVVWSHDGLDEISPAAPTVIYEVTREGVRGRDYSPEDLGVPPTPLQALAGGDPTQNAARLGSILKGEPHPAATAIALNAGAALYVAGLSETIKQGVAQAQATLRAGTGWEKLSHWTAWTRERAGAA